MTLPVRVYAPGQDLTTVATGTIAPYRLVAVSADRSGGNLAVAYATAAGRALGVSTHDAASGETLTIARGGIVRVTASAAITAGAAIEVATDGKAVTATTGIVVGTAVTGAASGALVEVAIG